MFLQSIDMCGSYPQDMYTSGNEAMAVLTFLASAESKPFSTVGEPSSLYTSDFTTGI